jgi:MoaA/NifB/PqqE/SkfB family radical SAM enzyme
LPIPVKNLVTMAGAALRTKVLGGRVPLNVMLALTDRCTGNCSYCQLPARKSPEMSTEEILRLIDQAADGGCQRIGLWGGEPLLRDDIGAIIRKARSRGIFVTVDTNGHLVERRADELAAANHVNISLDGDRRSHDLNRGEGSFDRTMAGLRYALSKKMAVWTISVLSRHNVDQVDWVLQTAREMGFLATFQVLHHNDQIGCNQDLYAGDREVREAIRLLIARKNEGWPVASSRRYLEAWATWPDYTMNRLSRVSGYPKCFAGKLYCNVDVDGSMYPCSIWVNEMEKPPNVRELGFMGAFNALKIPDCQACLATCFTEYNLLFSLDIATGLNWVRSLIR